MYRELGVITSYGWVRRFVAEPDYEAALARLPRQGAFASAYWYDKLVVAENGRAAPDPQAALVGDAYFDLDLASDDPPSQETWPCIAGGAQQLLRWLDANWKIAPDQARLYFSGRRGLHVLVPQEVLGSFRHPQLHLAYRRLAESIREYLKSQAPRVKLDLIYDRRRMFRLPNTRHERTGLYKVRLSPQELRDFSWEDLCSQARCPRPDPVSDSQKVLAPSARSWLEGELWKIERRMQRYARRPSSPRPPREDAPAYPCLQELLSAVIPKGGRNVACAVLASCYLQRGFDFGAARATLLSYNEEHCQPPLSPDEVTRVVISIYRHGYRYGCTSLQELSTCRPDACPLYAQRRPRRTVL